MKMREPTSERPILPSRPPRSSPTQHVSQLDKVGVEAYLEGVTEGQKGI